MAQLQAVARGLVAFFAEYDLLLTPALGERPVPIGEIHGCGEDPMADLKRSARFTPFTSLWNVTGQPAISIPLGFGDDGLPTAAQLVAKPLGEDTLLQVAAQMEAAVGRPPSRSRSSSRRAPEHVGHAPRADAEPLGVGRAAGREHRHGQQLRLVPGGEGGRARRASRGRAAAAAARVSGTGTRRRAPAGAAERELDDLAVAEDVGAGELEAPGGAARRAR